MELPIHVTSFASTCRNSFLSTTARPRPHAEGSLPVIYSISVVTCGEFDKRKAEKENAKQIKVVQEELEAIWREQRTAWKDQRVAQEAQHADDMRQKQS